MADPFERDDPQTPGACVEIAPGLRRLLRPNPSPMTFTGTNTWILGRGAVAVIDPGPDRKGHLDELSAALAPGERVACILATHSHADHSPAAAGLRAATGAPVLGFGPHGAGISTRMAALAASGADLGGGEGADAAFRPDRTLRDGEIVEGEGWRLRALHTPGHLSNHLCFAVEALESAQDLPGFARPVFTGDLLMGWATTMVSPPDGDMCAFMASLRRLRAETPSICLPGHGLPVRDPIAMIDHQIAHRETRERQILETLRAMGPAAPAALTARIYADVDPRLHGAAARNVFSHLLGLVQEGRAVHRGALSPRAEFVAL